MCGGAEGHFGLMTQHVVGKRGQSSGLPQRQLPSKSGECGPRERGCEPGTDRSMTGCRSCTRPRRSPRQRGSHDTQVLQPMTVAWADTGPPRPALALHDLKTRGDTSGGV